MADDEPLQPGLLVRYVEKPWRWYFARIRRVHPDGIDLVFFDASPPTTVPRSQVEGLDVFLGERERVFSRTRSKLTELFYGRELVRPRKERIREMKQALRKAGVSFDPAEWPTADTRVRLRRDGSFIQRKEVDSALAELLPQWLAPFVLPSGSRDPLGLQAPAERLVNEVLPGLTVFTFRAGYYGFLTWAIRLVNGLRPDIPRRDLLNALERAVALCEFVHHGTEDDSCALIGQRSKSRVLSSHESNSYRVPQSILKNQNTAGSYRLFATSLVSLGFAEGAADLQADGFLPHRLTPLGEQLARVFEGHVDSDSLLAFAKGERRKSRETIEGWGKELCFSSLARRAAFRKPFLRGLLLDGNPDAEKRHATVTQLFAQGLFGTNEDRVSEELDEESAAILDEEGSVVGGMSNLDVVLHFYECAPEDTLRSLQCVAVFELLSLGLSAIFRAAVVAVTEIRQVSIAGLARSIASAGSTPTLWGSPMKDAEPASARAIVDALLESEEPNAVASLGAALLHRVVRDPLLPAVHESLKQMVSEPVELVDRGLRDRMGQSFQTVLPDLIIAMVERHELVSRRKNRQRWLYVDHDTLVGDDPHAMGLGLHALRFPQLGSIARDIELCEEDLRGG